MAKRKDRLLKLAAFLETVPRKAFDLSSWESHSATKPEGKRPGDCGFAGCAVGWACHANLFDGLAFDPVKRVPLYDGFKNWSAVGQLFGFEFDDHWQDCGDGEHLFADYCYSNNPTPKQVAKRIRQFVKEH